MRIVSRVARLQGAATLVDVTQAHIDATIAFVDAIAGMMFFTTPLVSCGVTPGMPNVAARLDACSNIERAPGEGRVRGTTGLAGSDIEGT